MTTTFKVGDRVRVLNIAPGSYKHDGFTNSMLEYVGKEFTVKSVGEGGGYPVRFKETDYNYQPDWLELVKSPKFEVGQKVKVAKFGSGFAPDEVGLEVTIIEVGFDDYRAGRYCYRIKEMHGNNNPFMYGGWHGEESFEDLPVKAATPRKRKHFMSNKQKREILQTTKGKFFSVEFIKQDGSLRKMNCRMGVAKDLKGGVNSCAKHDEYVTVYDMVNKGYRNINLETLKSVKMAGATITFD